MARGSGGRRGVGLVAIVRQGWSKSDLPDQGRTRPESAAQVGSG